MSAPHFAIARESPKGEPAVSRARADEVRLATRDRVTLAAVAQDNSHGAAADWVIGQVFHAVQQARGRQVGQAIRRALQAAVQAIYNDSQGNLRVSATAAAVWRGNLFVSHTGGSAAFHVRGVDVAPLSGLGGPRIGGGDAPWVESTPMEGRPLARGDRVILVSDRLLQASPEDGRPFLDPKAMPELVNGVPPLESARHLISIALGRDAPEDLAVAVLAVPGVVREKRPRRAWRLALAALGLLAMALVAFGAWWLAQGGVAPASEYGYAVLIRGGLREDGQEGSVPLLQPLPALSTFTALQDSSLGLQSTFTGPSDISDTALHLGGGARIKLAVLDRRPPEADSAAAPTQFDQLVGSALILRGGGEREVRIEALGGYASLVGPGRAALGVTLDASGAHIDCLIGTCVFRPPSAEPVLLFAGQRLAPGQAAAQLFATQVHQDWDRLCAGCLTAP